MKMTMRAMDAPHPLIAVSIHWHWSLRDQSEGMAYTNASRDTPVMAILRRREHCSFQIFQEN